MLAPAPSGLSAPALAANTIGRRRSVRKETTTRWRWRLSFCDTDSCTNTYSTCCALDASMFSTIIVVIIFMPLSRNHHSKKTQAPVSITTYFPDGHLADPLAHLPPRAPSARHHHHSTHCIITGVIRCLGLMIAGELSVAPISPQPQTSSARGTRGVPKLTPAIDHPPRYLCRTATLPDTPQLPDDREGPGTTENQAARAWKKPTACLPTARSSYSVQLHLQPAHQPTLCQDFLHLLTLPLSVSDNPTLPTPGFLLSPYIPFPSSLSPSPSLILPLEFQLTLRQTQSCLWLQSRLLPRLSQPAT